MVKKMNKQEISNFALSHSMAFASELIRNKDDDNNCPSDQLINKSLTIQQLQDAVKDEHHLIGTNDIIRRFNSAMEKVVPFIDYPEHCGTEDRGWYRVFADLTGEIPYFCKFELGHDVYMAYTFFEHGAIDGESFSKYKTRITSFLINDRYKGNKEEALANFRPEWNEKILDMSQF